MYDEENKCWVLTEIATGNVEYLRIDAGDRFCSCVIRVDRKIYYTIISNIRPFPLSAFCFDIDSQQTKEIFQNRDTDIPVANAMKLGKHHVFKYDGNVYDVDGNVILTYSGYHLFMVCENDNFCILAATTARENETDIYLGEDIQEYTLHVMDLISCRKIMSVNFYVHIPTRSGMPPNIRAILDEIGSEKQMKKDFVRENVKLYPGDILHVVGMKSVFPLTSVAAVDPIYCDTCKKECIVVKYLDNCGHYSTCADCSKGLEKCKACGMEVHRIRKCYIFANTTE